MAQESLASANAAAQLFARDVELAPLRIFPEGVNHRLSLTTASATTSAFTIGTRAARLTATADCHYTQGVGTPEATTSSNFLPAGVDREIVVASGNKIAARTVSSTGVLFVTELNV